MGFNFIVGDTYTHGQLNQFYEITLQNLTSAVKDVRKHMSYAKYGLPNYRFELIRKHERMSELNNSLHNIIRAIEAGQGIEDRPQDIINNAI